MTIFFIHARAARTGKAAIFAMRRSVSAQKSHTGRSRAEKAEAYRQAPPRPPMRVKPRSSPSPRRSKKAKTVMARAAV